MAARNTHSASLSTRRAATAALVAMAVAVGCGDDGGSGRFDVVERGTFVLEREEDGELAALESLTVSSRIRGQIEFLAKDLEEVEEGAVLIELDKTELKTDLKRAEDDLEASEKRLAEALRNLEVESGQLEVELERKRAGLGLAKVRLQTVQAGATSSSLSIAEMGLKASLAALSIADNNLRDVLALKERGFATDAEVDRRRLERERAFVTSEKARMELEALRSLPTGAELRPVELDVQEATLELAITEERTKARMLGLKQSVEWARAAVSRHKERIRRVKEELENCTIKAPRAGLVVRSTYSFWMRQKVDVGTRVWPGIGLVELPDLSRMKVEAQIPEALIRYFEVGDEVEVQVDVQDGARARSGNKETFAGHILWIDNWARDKNAKLEKADQEREGLSGIRVFKTEIELDAEDERLRMGTRATVTLRAELDETVSVDLRAVWNEDGEHYVMRLAGDATEIVSVSLGAQNEKRAVVLDGLSPGDRVVLYPHRNGLAMEQR